MPSNPRRLAPIASEPPIRTHVPATCAQLRWTQLAIVFALIALFHEPQLHQQDGSLLGRGRDRPQPRTIELGRRGWTVAHLPEPGSPRSRSRVRKVSLRSRSQCVAQVPKLQRGQGFLQWRRADSNRRPPACKAGALPAELRPPFLGGLTWDFPNLPEKSAEHTADRAHASSG